MMEVENSSEEVCEKYESLLTCVDKFIEHIRDKPGTCKKLAKAFPKCYKENPEVIQITSDQIWETFASNQKSHIMMLIDEQNIKYSLSQLDTADVVQGNAWRPSGKPHEDITPRLARVKAEEIGKLTDMVQRAKAEADVLSDEMERKENKLRMLMDQVKTEVENWEEMSAECKSRSDDIANAAQQVKRG